MKTPLTPLALAGAWSMLAACGGTDATPTDAGISTAASCVDIITVCHDADPGTGPIHDCHETAHDQGTAAACDPIRNMCVALCEAAPPPVGADAALDHDGGTAGHAHDAAAPDAG
jgi:hypothetical protein